MEEKHISAAVIKRLPRYYRYLSDLHEENVERISSDELSRRMNVTASQIRQDLNNFGGFGQQGYGYNVAYLRTEIGKILGLNKTHNIVIIGGGNLGKALAGYSNFASRGFLIKGIFDSNPELIGKKIRDIKIMSMGVLENFLKENDIAIVTLAIPRDEAVNVAKKLYEYGVRAIWNFAHVDLDLPPDAYVENVHLSESLMQLSYRLNMRNGKEQK